MAGGECAKETEQKGVGQGQIQIQIEQMGELGEKMHNMMSRYVRHD